MKDYILEGCVDSVESAEAAAGAGANRLELCGSLIIGGTTPTRAVFEEVQAVCNVPVRVLIRPRFGDFCYSDAEFRICVREVEQFRELGAEGVVIGILHPDGTMDSERMKELIAAAGSMKVTLHRAFDVCVDPFDALEKAILLGVDTILTSGQQDSCVKGADLLGRLQEQGDGRIRIMAGGGVNAGVIPDLFKAAGITAYHMSGKKVLDSRMEYRSSNVHMGLDSLSEYEIWRTDGKQIKAAAEVIAGL